ncbi:VTT domain-containing protein [Acetobacter sp. AN02]|uniref:DedA family protein n=1 Tax=Acetobacter sp. AN02 TaxID=2894186 RepID=UPI0024341BAF|nr:VTT domain-containing protein [Acetobacter sp. AN02]MDG6093776.1 VTT domain-containing protein [Acetobacter sp. AN02]
MQKFCHNGGSAVISAEEAGGVTIHLSFTDVEKLPTLWQVPVIIAATYLLEDGATVATALAVADGHADWMISLAALWFGIISGDAGLYGLGMLATRFVFFRRWLPDEEDTPGWEGWKLFRVVFISRFIPGSRLPLYTTCGYFGANFGIFITAVIIATLIWTTVLFEVSLRAGHYLESWLGTWRWVGVAGMIIATILIGHIVARQRKKSGRAGKT